MIEAGVIVNKGSIMVNTSNSTKVADTNLIRSALATIKSQDSKVVQVGHLRLGIAAIKYKSDLMVFGTFGDETEPQMLLDSAGDLAEIFIRSFGGRDLTDKSILLSLKRELAQALDAFNDRIAKNQRTIVQIDQNLQEGIDIGKQSMDKFMERGDKLNDMYHKSSALNSDALNFEKSGRRLKQDIQRQKLKMYAVVACFVLFTFYFFYKVL